MITDDDIYFTHNGENGVPLAWIIDENVVHDLPLYRHHASIFLNHDEVVDISDQYPEHDGITVKFIKDNQILEIFQTSEYFGSILLSNPQVINLLEHENGVEVYFPNAKFVDNKIVILERPYWEYE